MLARRGCRPAHEDTSRACYCFSALGLFCAPHRGSPETARVCAFCSRSGPTTVLVLSLLFIAFVVLLHIWGKFRKG